jgi:hypothetical protein
MSTGGAFDELEFLPNWCQLCHAIWAAVQRWPDVEHITIETGWFHSEERVYEEPPE